MHVHPPKPLHGWKEFLNEIFVIVVGVLIALGFEQVVEELHWQHKVAEGRERLDEEIKSNYRSAVAQVAVAPCLNAQFDALERRILASGATLDPAPAYPQPDRLAFAGAPPIPILIDHRVMQSAVWDTLNTDGTVLHIPILEQRRLGVIYYFAARYTESVNQLDPMSELTVPIPLSAEVRYQLLARLETYRKNRLLVVNAAVQLAAFARQMNHFLPDEEAEASIRTDQAKTIALCLKAGYPVADWKAAIAKVKSMRALGS